jgi:hypothetical protein
MQRVFDTYHNDHKYSVSLDENGNPIAYAVQVITRSGKATFRNLWAKRDGKPMPQRLKDILNGPRIPEFIASAMGW